MAEKVEFNFQQTPLIPFKGDVARCGQWAEPDAGFPVGAKWNPTLAQTQ